MLFAIICTDKPASLDLRVATRPTHIEYLTSQAGLIMHGGPTLDAEGRPRGSLLLIDVKDQAAAEAFAAADPYAQAGLFQDTQIHPYRAVFRDGETVE